MICQPLLSLVLTKSAVLVVRVVMTVAVLALVLIVPLRAVLFVVQLAATLRRPMEATSPQRRLAPMQTNPPLSAYAQSPRQLQQLTAKENNHVATRSPEIPQRAKGP
jgi:hypothetical protein